MYMRTNEATATAANLERMDRQRQIAQSMGFLAPKGRDGNLTHVSDLAELSVTDPEVSWRLSLKEARTARFSGKLSTYTIETGSIELSNLTDAQFRAILMGALTSLGIW
jgi:hypothetical protein